MNCLDVDVTYFNDCYDKKGQFSIRLIDWVKADEFKEEVLAYQLTENELQRKSLKEKLPCITPSGVFSGSKIVNLISHSGIICIDIDAKDNEHLEDFENMKSTFADIENVAYCGHSISGEGFFLLIPIADPNLHGNYFDSLQKWFKKKLNVVIDPTCTNVNKKRTISYDDNPYINPIAIPLKIKQPHIFDKKKKLRRFVIDRKSPKKEVEKLKNYLSIINKNKFDITENEYQWKTIGFSIVSLLGEQGRQIFHDFSKYYKNKKYHYIEEETDKMYDYCLTHPNNYSIGTLFYFCEKELLESGIIY